MNRLKSSAKPFSGGENSTFPVCGWDVGWGWNFPGNLTRVNLIESFSVK